MSAEQKDLHWPQTLVSLAWPAFAFIVLISFWGPLHRTAERLPDALDRSTTINVAGVKLELGKGNRFRKPSPAVAEVLKNIYAEDLKALLASPDVPNFARPDRVNEYRSRYAHLVELGLITESASSMIPLGGGPPSEGYTFKMTQLGLDSKSYLVDLIVGTLVHE